jgi:hypothetical protein
MQTGDAELEMRGRCSAGQKVCYVIAKSYNIENLFFNQRVSCLFFFFFVEKNE